MLKPTVGIMSSLNCPDYEKERKISYAQSYVSHITPCIMSLKLILTAQYLLYKLVQISQMGYNNETIPPLVLHNSRQQLPSLVAVNT